MDRDEFSDVLGDAMPKCPSCLVQLEAQQEGELVWLVCPQCDHLFM